MTMMMMMALWWWCGVVCADHHHHHRANERTKTRNDRQPTNPNNQTLKFVTVEASKHEDFPEWLAADISTARRKKNKNKK